MKNFFFLYILFFTLFISKAEEIDVNGLYYEIISEENKTVSMVRCPNSFYFTKKVNIPNTVIINDIKYTVTEIGESAFKGNSYVEEINLPNSIITIGSNAFYDCTGISQIKIPDSVLYLGEGVFAESYLDSVYLSKQLVEIPDKAFQNCHQLKYVFIPESLRVIGSSAFYNSCINNIELPNSIISIGSQAFYGCDDLTIRIPDSVVTIGRQAFAWTENLNLTLSDSIEELGEEAFYSSNITSIILPKNLKNLSKGLFRDCYYLTNVTLPTHLETIKDYSFSNCLALDNLQFPIGMSTIGSYAFQNCSSLRHISLPSTINSIKEGAFYLCTNLKSAELPNNLTTLATNIFFNCKSLENVVFPKVLTSIGNSAFYGCSSLSYVELPNTLKIIDSNAFFQAGLISLFIPDSVDKLNTFCFNGCNKLESLIIGNSLKTLTGTEFSNCTNLSYLTLGNSLENISYSTFTNCDNIIEIFCLSHMPPHNDSEAYLSLFSTKVYENAILHIPYGSKEYYMSQSSFNPWVKFLNIEEMEAPYIEAESITLNLEQILLEEREMIQLVASVFPENTTDKFIIWNSSNSKIASVNEDGMVTAHSTGECTITASCGEVSTSCMITVKKPKLKGLEIIPNSAIIKTGTTLQLNVIADPIDADFSLIWETSDDQIAIVEDNGLVKGLLPGNVIIKATSENGLTANSSIIVESEVIEIEEIHLNVNYLEMEIGEEVILNASFIPENATETDLTWTSSNINVVKVDNGIVKAQGEGYATITVMTSNELTATCDIVVTTNETTTVNPTSIRLNSSEVIIKQGDFYYLTAFISPENATNKSVVWSSSNPDILVVDSNGMVSALEDGEAIVTASTFNALTASCNFIVEKKDVEVIYVEQIVLDELEINAIEGDEFTLIATIYPENATDKTLFWESSDKNVVSVNKMGECKITGEGKAIITVKAQDGSGVTAECLVTGYSGVDEILDDKSGTWKIINLKGEMISQINDIATIKNLRKGIYILTNGKKSIRLYIK